MRRVCTRKNPAPSFAAILPLLCAVGASRPASAADPVGWYAGGAIGRAEVVARISAPGPIPFPYRETHAAFKLLVGVRPVALAGAEVSYMDFGHPGGNSLGNPANASMKGGSAFGIFYFPVPVIDLYLKAGVARIQSAVSGLVPVLCIAPGPCPAVPFQERQSNTGFASGLGVQIKFGSWATRAEYERFNAAGESPYVWSLGETWSF